MQSLTEVGEYLAKGRRLRQAHGAVADDGAGLGIHIGREADAPA